ncbi:TIGR01777 family oxidoreductase [Lysobacter sp. H23M47]|uniref:TIGR01777 family oxidoreductase n=1 Tax=Lysobacter sp. H23M47 TaxID=2781024 RepID=UPI00187F1FBE|nr:TIGR01777 family oxidoreductase [Lysobacter sp. H23M47]QOW24887.1 TIGR01777 family protein [Lysobacter sp. H23M47]
MKPIRFADEQQHVLVTGATGFIGQELVRALLDDGHTVTALSRDPQRARSLFDGRVHAIGNMASLPDDHRVDVIVNLAGARILGARWTDRRKQMLMQSRIGTTRSLVEWIARSTHKPALLLNGSAIGYYGVQRQGDDTPLSEDSPPQPVFMSQLCQAWEAEAARAADHGVVVACMRFGLVLGHGGALPMMLLPFKLGLGGRTGTGRQWLSWIHIHDLLRGVAHLWPREATRVEESSQASPAAVDAYNFVAPGAVHQADFANAAASVLHRPALLPAPAWPLRLALGEQSDLVLEGQRVVPAALTASGFVFDFPDILPALASLCGPVRPIERVG